MAKSKSSVLLCCLAVFLALYNEGQAQFLPFSLGDSDNDCYVQCPMECPQLNLNMVDCVVYCKTKCACPADDAECATKAMDKMQKAADERESTIGPEEEAAAESPASDAPSASESDGDLAFATEDGETSLSPEAMPPEIDTTSFVIEMDLSPTPSAGAPEAPASQSAAAATPQSATAPTPQSPAAHTPKGATAPTPQGAASPTSSQAAASPASDNTASPAPQVALTPNAPAPA